MAEGESNDTGSKVDKLAADALEVGKRFVATDAGKKVAEVTDTAFATAEELRKKVVQSELGRNTLASGFGRQAIDFTEQVNEKAKATIPNALARNVAIGAAAGAVIALPLPIIGPIIGALIGGGIGYLRTITKKP